MAWALMICVFSVFDRADHPLGLEFLLASSFGVTAGDGRVGFGGIRERWARAGGASISIAGAGWVGFWVGIWDILTSAEGASIASAQRESVYCERGVSRSEFV